MLLTKLSLSQRNHLSLPSGPQLHWESGPQLHGKDEHVKEKERNQIEITVIIRLINTNSLVIDGFIQLVVLPTVISFILNRHHVTIASSSEIVNPSENTHSCHRWTPETKQHAKQRCSPVACQTMLAKAQRRISIWQTECACQSSSAYLAKKDACPGRVSKPMVDPECWVPMTAYIQLNQKIRSNKM